MLLPLLLVAAAPPERGAREERPTMIGPTVVGADWLRGGAEPEAVYGPRRAVPAERLLAGCERPAWRDGPTAPGDRPGSQDRSGPCASGHDG
jgi:hypothetical protein